jgi:hypothetical protein
MILENGLEIPVWIYMMKPFVFNMANYAVPIFSFS